MLGLIICLVSPFFALLFALSNITAKSSRYVIWLFCGFYGLAFFIAPNSEADCVRYREWLVEMHDTTTTLESLSSAFYSEGNRYYDIYQPLLTFFVSRFTSDYRILFCLFGLVFGYFYSGVIYFFIDRLKQSPRMLEWWLLLALAFSINVGSGINNSRIYTGCFVFLYGALYYWERGNPRFLIYCFLSPLIHFALFIPVAILFAVPFAKNLRRPLWVVLGVTFVISGLELEFFQRLIGLLPFGFATRVGGYATEGAVDTAPIIISTIRWLILGFLFSAVTYETSLHSKDQFNRNAWTFLSLLCIATNLASSIGQIERFYSIALVLAIGLMLLQINAVRDFNRDSVFWGYLISSLLVLNTLLGIRLFLGMTSEHLILGNWFTLFYLSEPDRSLYDYIR